MSTKAELVQVLVSNGATASSMLMKKNLATLEQMVADLDSNAPVAGEYTDEKAGRYGVGLVNMVDGSVQGHAAGCRDLRHSDKHADMAWTLEVADKHEAFVAYNSDFIDEAEAEGAEDPFYNTYAINWLPCADHVPAGETATQEAAPLASAVVAEIPASWDTASYRKCWAKFLAAGGNAAQADEAMAALHTWQKATDRRGVSNSVKTRQSQEFLISYRRGHSGV